MVRGMKPLPLARLGLMLLAFGGRALRDSPPTGTGPTADRTPPDQDRVRVRPAARPTLSSSG